MRQFLLSESHYLQLIKGYSLASISNGWDPSQLQQEALLMHHPPATLPGCSRAKRESAKSKKFAEGVLDKEITRESIGLTK